MRGSDVVALMPTGGGKSLCYQLPALISNKTTLIISPLIALMKDQVDGLNARGIGATYINSSLTPEQISQRYKLIKSGQAAIIYVAPERLSNFEFRRILSELDVYLVAVDEAHCVSSWGHDFRPDYLLIHEFIKQFKQRPIVAAFTATATPEVVEDIKTRLQMRAPNVFTRGFNRPNLRFFARERVSGKKSFAEVLRLINSVNGAAIVYTLSRAGAEELAKFLSQKGLKAAAYHAGLPKEKRSIIQEHFMENRLQVIVATIAFGMGVDKADIRLVVHVGIPSSLEGYYQEAGRAGRDGEIAYCVVIPTGRDIGLHHYFIQKNIDEMYASGKPSAEVARITSIKYQRLEAMKNYVTNKICRRRAILTYFSDPDLANYQTNCGGCDICLNYSWKKLPRKREIEKDDGELSATANESVQLFSQGRAIEQIAKIRGLGVSTIWGHLLKWYSLGGKFPAEKYLPSAIEKQILLVLPRAQADHKLRSVKDLLPSSITYEQIKLAMIKGQKGR